MNGDPLLNQLRQFAETLAEKNIPLVIGGGYGLLLKANHIQRLGARTRLEQIPIARSTGDIDVFLTTEVIINKNNMAAQFDRHLTNWVIRRCLALSTISSSARSRSEEHHGILSLIFLLRPYWANMPSNNLVR
jgi:hypothetical protein